MTADLNVPTQRPHIPGHHDHADDPASQIIAAERELSAFLIAVRQRSGAAIADRAADYWLQAFEAADLTPCPLPAGLRRVTIAAASRLAND